MLSFRGSRVQCTDTRELHQVWKPQPTAVSEVTEVLQCCLFALLGTGRKGLSQHIGAFKYFSTFWENYLCKNAPKTEQCGVQFGYLAGALTQTRKS